MSNPNPPVQNIVLLMLENRSYDNVLGMLYGYSSIPIFQNPPAGQQNLDGAANAQPNVNNTVSPTVSYSVWGTPNDSTTIPQTDPGEYFQDMAQQFLGQTQAAGSVSDTSPYPVIADPQAPLSSVAGPLGLMGGFVTNYAQQSGNTESPGDVMHCYLPDIMMITGFLANRFMVCDSWYASVPTQTFANRLFSLCGGCEELLDDGEYIGFLTGGYKLPNIFEALDDELGTANVNWKVYFHDYSMAANLIQYVNGYLTSSTNQNLVNYNDQDYPPGSTNPLTNPPNTSFLQDCANGTLAPFSLIEPRYSNNYPGMASGLLPNSNHPGLSDYPLVGPDSSTVPIDVYDGELLLLEVFGALLGSPQWANTMLIVTYDEPGGLYDHVQPPPATQPSSGYDASNGFQFNWLGGRVPAIIISPFAPQGSQLASPNGPFDHTSIIATVLDYLIPTSTYFASNARVAAAPTINAAAGFNGSGNTPDAAGLPKMARR